MTTVKEIENAISQLPPTKLSVFRSWFERFDASCWDKQLVENINDGKFDAIATKVRESYKKGKCKEL